MKKISAPQISGVQSNVYELMGNFFKYCKENGNIDIDIDRYVDILCIYVCTDACTHKLVIVVFV